MPMRTLLVGLLCGILLAAPVFGADNPAHPDSLPELNSQSTLDDYLAYAALNNPGLKAEFHRWKAALEKIPRVKAMPDPRFNYTYFVQSIETRVGPQRQRLGLSQTFPWFGKFKLQGDVAMQAANARQQRYEAAKRQLFYRVKTAYYDLYFLGQNLTITEKNLELMTYLEEVARTKFQANMVPHATLIKAQIELGKLEDRLLSLQDLAEPVKARLNAALNRPAQAELPLPTTVDLPDSIPAEETLLDSLASVNPELRALAFSAASEQTAIDLAKKQGLPDLTFGLEFMETGTALNPDLADSGKDPIGLMVSMNIPLWRGKYNAAQREAEQRFLATQHDHVEAKNKLETDLKIALYEYRDAERKIELYRNSLLPRAEQSLNVTQQAFVTGTVDFLDLIDAQRTLLEFELTTQQAITAKAKTLAKIEMVVGMDLSQ